MPLYPSSSSAARPRRPRDRDKDKDGRSSNLGSSSRRHKEVSRSSTRTPPRPLRSAQPSLYHQGENLTLDQLHPFPGPEPVSVTPSASPPVPPATSAFSSPASSMILPAHHQSPANSLMLTGHQHLETPLALQPYLDHDDNDDDEEEDEEEEEPSFTTVPESRNIEERETSSTKSASPKSIEISLKSKTVSPKQISQKLENNSPTTASQDSEPPVASPASVNPKSETQKLEPVSPVASNHEKSSHEKPESVSPTVASHKSEPVSPIVANHQSKQASLEFINRSLNTTPPPQADNQLLDMTPSRIVNQTLDIASPRPVNQPSESKLVKHALEQPSPRLINHHLDSVAIISQSTPSPKSIQTTLYRSPSSPPPSASPPFWNHPPPVAGVYDPNQRFPQPLLYVNSPPQFAPPPPVPYFPGHPAEHYYSSQYCGPPYMPLSQNNINSTELQNSPPQAPPFFTNYPPPPPLPQQIQPLLHSMHNPSIRGHSPTGSRRSFSEEHQYPTLNVTQLSGNPADRILPAESFDHEREDDPGNLLQRLQSAIPDLHLLLNKYQETSSQAEFRKSQIRENEAQRSAQLKQKENCIERLGRDLESASSKHAAESNMLRREIGDMEEKQKDLEDVLWAEKKAKDELEAANRALRLEKEVSEVRLTEEKNGMARDVSYWREKESKEAAKIKALEAELEHQRRELEAQITVLTKHHAKEKEELQSGWAKQRREIEDGNMRIKRDLEASLKAQQKVNEEDHRKYMQDLESRNKERESLSVSWDEERTILGKGWEEQRKILSAKHQTEKDEMLKKWQASQSRASKSAEEENLRLQKEIEKLRAGWDAEKEKFAKATTEMRNAAMKLNEENVKLQRLAEAFGEVTDLKSREDPFYDDAFHHLYKQISDLTSDHFRDAIDEPPEEVIKSIPPTIPPFFSSTDSSIKLRAAYVEHLISTIISRRIFQPFLFTITLRHGNPDLLFQSMSDHLRKKSTRREALWRQRTLHAAYTISSAKQSINKIAAYIVDEVVDAIKYFTSHHRWEQVTVAVRRIIKTAAETWRYARLEVAMITASATADDRPDFQRASNLIETIANGPNAPDPQRQLLLSLFPIIEREAIHEDIREDKHPEGRGYIYFPGRMLYSDDTIIVKRLEEIHMDEMRLAGKEGPQRHDDDRVKDRVDEDDGNDNLIIGNNENMRQFNANEGSPFLTNGAGPTPPRSPARNRSGSDSRVFENKALCTTPASDLTKWIGGDRSSTEFELSPNTSSISSPRRHLLRRDSSTKRKYSSGSHSSGGRSASTSDATRSSSTTLGPSAMPPSWGGSLGNGGIAFPRVGLDRWTR